MIDKVELEDMIHKIDYTRTINSHDRVFLINYLDKYYDESDQERLEKIMSLCRSALYENKRQAWDKAMGYLLNEDMKDRKTKKQFPYHKF